MKVLNIHKSKIVASKDRLFALFSTLSKKNDHMWPSESWPDLKFKNGLKVISEAGHGLIKYRLVDYYNTGFAEFRFLGPKGFNGMYKFEISELNNNKTEIKHTIDMKTSELHTIS
jgi:hypothetical protein